MPNKVNTFIKALQNPAIAFALILACLLVFGVIFPVYWISVFTIIFTYLASDLVLSLFIKGGNGIAVIPAINNKTKHKGHTFLVFFGAIIASTLISEFFNDFILMLISQNSEIWYFILFLASIGLAGAVFADLQAKFYAHDEE
jgi:hypothetical protein